MKELAYIQSTGSQWIDTGIKAASNLKFEIVFETSGSTNYQAVFGGRTGNKKFYFLNSVVADYSQKELGFGANIYKPTPSISTHSIKTTLVWDGASATLTTAQGTFTTGTMSGSFSDGLNQYLFCFNDGGSANNNGNMKLYSCKIYSAGTLVRDFIPVLDDSDVACLYDRVTSAYFYNQGSGTFTAGNKPQFLTYIQSTGTQYINTGKTPTINTKFEITLSDVVKDSGEVAIFGSGSYSSNTYLLTKDASTHYIEWYYPTKQRATTDCTSKHKIELYRGSITVDGVVVTSGTTTGATSFSAVTLFNVANGYFSKYKLYRFKMYESDQLVFDAVPALDGSTVCLYDKVSESFLYNAGSGSFVGGDPLEPPVLLEYIQSSGTQYINTGIKENLVYSFEMGYTPVSLVEQYQSYLGGTLDNFTVGALASLTTNYIRHRTTEIAQPHPSTSDENVLSVKDGKVVMNETQIATVSTANPVSTTSTNNICVFCNGSLSRKSAMKLYFLKLYDSSGNLLRDLVPALDGTTVCMYDNVSESFFYNSGTGDFISGGVIVSQKFLLESGNDYYTISGGILTNLGSTLNAQLFADYGLDDVPDWSDYSSLPNPTVLCWNSDEFVNMIATTTGLPQPQTITTAGISLTTAGTDGIDHMDIVESGSPTYAFSVDNGTTWKIWNGSAWVVSSGTNMDGADVEAITKAQWDLLIDGESFIKIRFTLSAAVDNVESITVVYANV